MKDALSLLQKFKSLAKTMPVSEPDKGPFQSKYHAAAFLELREQLKPYAEGGDIRCQYVLACLYGIYPCYTTEEEARLHYKYDIQEATQWWVTAAKQGHPWALDNLVTCGVGPEAERASQAWAEFEKKRPELVGRYKWMPVYGPNFTIEFCRDYIGFVASDEEMNY